MEDAGLTPSVDSGTGPADAATNDGPPDMLIVPAGPFTMGRDIGGEDDEHPAHEVTLPSFYLDKTPVTNSAYLECVAAKACRRYDATVASSNHAGADALFR